MSESGLVKTLVFQLNVESDNAPLLRDATHEARRAYNETIRLAKAGVDWNQIPDRVAEDVDLVKNTLQRVVAKALGAMENYYEYDDYRTPSHTTDGPYPLRMNYREGYTLDTRDDGRVTFRISAKPYKHVRGLLDGSDAHLDTLRTALDSDRWRIGTAEALYRNGQPELHVNVTNTERTVRDADESRTFVGVDVNEANVALTAYSRDGVEDSVVIEFPDVKEQRHRYFTMRKRVQNAGKQSVHDVLEGREERYVRDRLHKVSRHIVEWTQQFERPCLVLEDLKDLRDGLDYGTRMNRRLHHLPYGALQFYTAYKAAFEGIPTVRVNPEYTSQACPFCGHTTTANRQKRRFKCRSCGRQDHADRTASVNIAVRGIERETEWTVPALNSLPRVTKVRRQASGAVDAPTVTHDTTRGHHADGAVGVSG